MRPQMQSKQTLKAVIAAAGVALAALAAGGKASAQEVEGCGNLRNAYGPKDYRTLNDNEKHLVEDAHFTEVVETLEKGQSGASAGGDLDYTLRAIPNHPRALLAMSRLGEKEKTQRPRGANWVIDCYFQRAAAFRPDDENVHVLFGYHLLRKGDKAGAIRELEKAQGLGADTANVHYNLGLAYFDAGRMDDSLREAKKAYSMGFPLPGLRDKLKRTGAWND